MFSDEDALKVDVADPEVSSADLHASLQQVAEHHGFIASLLVRIDRDGAVHAELADRLAHEPLRGKLRPVLTKLLDECTAKFPAVHVQSVSPSPIDQLRPVNPRVPFKYRILFVPYVAGDRRFAFLGFLGEGGGRAVPDGLPEQLAGVVRLVALSSALRETTERLHTLERYVKEIGHDIASDVQASVAKLRNIARGVVPENAVRAKAREAEQEILNTYRVASNLGVVVDPDYNIRNGTQFDIVEAARRVTEQFRAEAGERELELRLDIKTPHLQVWGDAQAIESALGHYINNAIKYSVGSRFVTIGVVQQGDCAMVTVTNRGITLKPDDRDRIWDFGFRGADALELHVNGSGIGLFSVRKIVRAHGGEASVRWEPEDPRVATFTFKIPIGRVLDKPQLLRTRK